MHFLSIQGSQPLVEGRRLYFLPFDMPFHGTCDLGGPLERPLERPLDPFDEDLLRSADPPFEGFQEVKRFPEERVRSSLSIASWIFNSFAASRSSGVCFQSLHITL